jgi:hypothetical protein
LTAVRFKTPPAVYGGVFQLVDKYLPGWPPPKQICCLDVSTNMIPPKAHGGFYPINQLMNATVPFTELILAQIPNGASFEIDIA